MENVEIKDDGRPIIIKFTFTTEVSASKLDDKCKARKLNFLLLFIYYISLIDYDHLEETPETVHYLQ